MRIARVRWFMLISMVCVSTTFGQDEKQQQQLRQFGKRTDLSPTIEHVSRVAPNNLCITIQAGRVQLGKFMPYVPHHSDYKQEEKSGNGDVREVYLQREGKTIGWLVGDKRQYLSTFDQVIGDPLLTFLADDVKQFTVQSNDDPLYTSPITPTRIARKSKPNDWAFGPKTFAIEHRLYLTLPHALQDGKHYTIGLGKLNTRTPTAMIVINDRQVRSDAVHVQQIGYRPDDPAKNAFVSSWLGTGGAMKLPETISFSVVDVETNQPVFQGKSRDIWPADRVEKMARSANFNGTDVARLDFSTLTKTGHFRVVVDGIGCSYPFEIGEGVWEHAFKIQMKGLYNNRSGMELGPPYTAFKKPRDMHPEDGYHVTQSSYRAVEDGGENMAKIVAGDTGKPVNGWGGYHDAGDWNPRRITHMKVTLAQLEIFDLFPRYFEKLNLNIPKTANVPDILTEAMYEVDYFKRMQHDDGGVGFGLESKGDPIHGEVSWINTFPSFALAPDYQSSWYYAATTARLARLLEPYDANLSKEYATSSQRAFDWAEQDYVKAKTANEKIDWRAPDDRNRAAMELYRLTRDRKYYDLFMQDTVLKDAHPALYWWGKCYQSDAVFAYACLPDEMVDVNLKVKAIKAICEHADKSLAYSRDNAFNVTTPDKYRPQFMGFYTTPKENDFPRAHYLTGKSEYLAGALLSTQFQAGCNPENKVYTTGLGANPVLHPLKLDSHLTGQDAPVGLTVFGNFDLEKWKQQTWMIWPITYHLSKNTTPDPYAWPVHENHFDIYLFPAMCEYVVDMWAPNVYTWGYLTARAQLSKP